MVEAAATAADAADLTALEDRRLLLMFTVNSTLDDGSAATCAVHRPGEFGRGGRDDHLRPDRLRHAQTITLTGGQLELSDTSGTETITGPAAGVTVSGDKTSRVFQVDPGVTARPQRPDHLGRLDRGNGGGLYNVGARPR